VFPAPRGRQAALPQQQLSRLAFLAPRGNITSSLASPSAPIVELGNTRESRARQRTSVLFAWRESLRPQLEIPLARIVLEESTPVELEAFPAPSASRERPRPTLASRSAQRAGLESTSSLRARQRAAIALAVTSLTRLACQRARSAMGGSTQMKRKALALTAE